MPSASPDTVERLFRQLAAQSNEIAVLLLDRHGKIVWWSPGARYIFGWETAQVLDQHVSKVFTPEDVGQGVPLQEIAIATSAGAAEDDRWMARSEGSRFWASGVLVALRDEHGGLTGFAKILRNRTDWNEHLESLKQQIRSLEEGRDRTDLFLRTLAHELRTPLTPMTIAVELIRNGCALPPETAPAFEVLDRQIESMRKLIEDLYDSSRAQTGKLPVVMQTVTLQDVLQRAADNAAVVARRRGQSLDTLLPPAPMLVHADPVRLEQIFANLLQNAIRYTPAGGHIWIHAGVEGDEAVTHVRDDGVGIPTTMLPRIFDLFTQVERTHTGDGLGLGLALVKDLVTLHRGTVQVRSEGSGKGSEFVVRLPLVRPDDAGRLGEPPRPM